MNVEESTYTAMREFIRVAVELEVKKALTVPNLDPGDVPLRAYAGIWREGRSYERGTLATRSGATWVATRSTMVQPGISDSGWKMISKGDK